MYNFHKSSHRFIPSSLLPLVFLSTLMQLSAPSSLLAQNLQGGLAPTLPSASAASYYYIAKPGELTMLVNVWGFVKNPGRYEVASSTNLIQLISFAGGPIENARLSEVKITRFVEKDSVLTSMEIIVNLDHLDSLEGSSLALFPGDTIFIDHTGWSTLRDAFSVVTTVGIITTAIAQLIIATGR